MSNESYKQQVYQKWLQNNRPWFSLDKSNEPSYSEKQIILEMLKRENSRVKSDIELEKRTAEIKQKYRGKIPDTIFDRVQELGDY